MSELSFRKTDEAVMCRWREEERRQLGGASQQQARQRWRPGSPGLECRSGEGTDRSEWQPGGEGTLRVCLERARGHRQLLWEGQACKERARALRTAPCCAC